MNENEKIKKNRGKVIYLNLFTRIYPVAQKKEYIG